MKNNIITIDDEKQTLAGVHFKSRPRYLNVRHAILADMSHITLSVNDIKSMTQNPMSKVLQKSLGNWQRKTQNLK